MDIQIYSSSSLVPSTLLSSPNILRHFIFCTTIDELSTVMIEDLFIGILLSFRDFFLYRWNKNRQKQKDINPIPGMKIIIIIIIKLKEIFMITDMK